MDTRKRRIQEYSEYLSYGLTMAGKATSLFKDDFLSSYFFFEIPYCNAHSGWSFTKAYVGLDPVVSGGCLQVSSLRILLKDAVKKLPIDEHTGTLLLSERRYETEDQKHALNCLEKYLQDLDKHSLAFQRIGEKEGASETEICAVLVAHLFSKLTSEADVVVNNRVCGLHSKFPECPCGCGYVIKKDATGIGNRHVWHGNVDILVKRTPIKVVKENTPEFDSSDESDEPEEKRIKVDDECDIKKGGTDLYSTDVNMQIASQTITNAFAQMKLSKLSNVLVPSIGCTLRDFIIYLYDPVEDILMRRVNKFRLFNDDFKIQPPCVIELWFILNFHLFYPGLSKEIVGKLPKSGFVDFIEKAGILKTYKENLEVMVNIQGESPRLEMTKLYGETCRMIFF